MLLSREGEPGGEKPMDGDSERLGDGDDRDGEQLGDGRGDGDSGGVDVVSQRAKADAD